MHQINHKFYFVIFLSLFFHIIASFYSIGWLSADEHSCILEYLNLKLGYISNPCFLNYVDGNAIDSSIKIRSWAQPFLYYSLSKIFIFFNVHDFFILTFLLKLFSSLIGWLSIIFFYLLTKNQFKNEIVKKLYLLLIFLFWFYPLLHARTSAENLSISFLLIGISFYLYSRNNIKVYKILILGLIFGLSFVFRYNLIFCIIFFYLWIIFCEKIDYKNKFKICFFSFLSGFLILLLELIINIWGFENYINFYKLLNLNYIVKNSPFLQFFLFFEGNNFYSGSNWSDHNFFSYLSMILLKFYPPLSIIVLLSFFYLIFKNYKNLIVWILLPYFLVHSYISHKELRYIFPILAFSPYFISYFFDNFTMNEKIKKNAIYLILILNFFGLIYVSFSSLRPELKVLNEIYKDYKKKIFYVNFDNSIKWHESLNPFEIDNITNNYYFKFENVEIIKKINSQQFKINDCLNGNQTLSGTISMYGNNYRSICTKKDFEVFIEEYKKNQISLNFIKQKKQNIIPMELKLINLSKNYKLKNFMNDYLADKNIFILTQDHNVVNNLYRNSNCKVLKNSKPMFISKIRFNKINERVENLVYFSCRKL